MTISGTIEQAQKDGYYFTDVRSNDIVFRAINNTSFAFGGGSNVLSAFRVNSNIVTITAPLIGVGTSNPQGIFHLQTSNVAPALILDGMGVNNRGIIRFTNTNAGNFIQSGMVLSNDSKVDIVFSSMMGTTEWMRIKSSTGAVGIGTNNPQSTLDVVGSGRFTTTLTTSSLFTSNITSTSSNMDIANDSNVRTLNLACASNVQTINIGTSPSSTTINIGSAGDTVNIVGNLQYVNTTNMVVADKLMTLNKGGASLSAGNAGIEIEENNAITGYIKTSADRTSFLFRTPAATQDLTMDISQNGMNINNSAFILTSNNRVGISTATPAQSLHVVGGIAGTSLYLAQPTASQAVPWSSTRVPMVGAGIASDNSLSILGSNNINIATVGSNASVNIFTNLITGNATNSNAKVTITNAGNVGIGSTNPMSRLDVVGGQARVGICGANWSFNDGLVVNGGDFIGSELHLTANGTGGGWHSCVQGFVNSNAGSNWYGPTVLALNPQGGSVGIGTTFPAQRLDVFGGVVLRYGNTPSTVTLPQITFAYSNSDNFKHNIRTRHTNTDTNSNAIDFYIWQANQGTTDLGNKAVMSVTSTGVGIGTMLPGYSLDVNGSINASNIFMNGIQLAVASYWFQSMGGNWSPCNVAIGSSSNPLYPLNVSGPIRTTGWTSINASNQGAYLNWNNNTGDGRTQIINSRGTGLGGFLFDMYTNSGYSNTAMMIDGNGNVGISTTTPASKLDVNGETRLKGRLNLIDLNSTSNMIFGHAGGDAAGDLHLWDWEKTRAVFGYYKTPNNFGIPNASVGIGTTNPDYKLDVLGRTRIYNNSNFGQLSVQSTFGGVGNTCSVDLFTYSNASLPPGVRLCAVDDGTFGGHFSVHTKPTGSTSNVTVERLRVTNAGDVGIGTTTPSYRLDVNGTSRVMGGQIMTTGNVVVANNITDGASWQYEKMFKVGIFNSSTYGSLVISGQLGYLAEVETFRAVLKFGTNIYNGVADVISSSQSGWSFWKNGKITFYSLNDGPMNAMHVYVRINNNYNTISLNVSATQWNGWQPTLFQNRVITGLSTYTLADFKSRDGDIVSAAGSLSALTTMAPNNFSMHMFDGNLGIGTLSPGYALDVVGTVNATGIRVGGSNLSPSATIDTTNAANITSGTLPVARGGTGTTTSTGVGSLVLSGSPTLTGTVSANAINIITTTGSNANFSNVTVVSTLNVPGNVGIGSTQPAFKLDISGSARITSALGIGSVAATPTPLYIGTTLAYSNTDTRWVTYMSSNGGNASFTGMHMSAGDNASQSLLMYAGGSFPNGAGIIQSKDTLAARSNNGQKLLLNPDGGNVGVGTTNPAYTLDINGVANATTIREGGTLLTTRYAPSNVLSNYLPLSGGTLTGGITGTSVTATTVTGNSGNFSNLNVPGTLTVVNSTETNVTTSNITASNINIVGNVGVGTINPSYRLDVSGTMRGSNILLGNVGSNDNNRMISALDGSIVSGSGRFIAIGSNYTLYNQAEFAYNHIGASSQSNYGSLGLYGGGALFWNGYGNVGIGITNPGYRLDVNGQANATSLSEGGTLISVRYAPSNVLSNYVLTSTANTQYAPSNQLANYVLTSTGNTQYAPSNQLSNYVRTTTANTQYAPSNQLANYVLTSTGNTQYAPSNQLSNYVRTTTANTQYAPSNQLSNYLLLSGGTLTGGLTVNATLSATTYNNLPTASTSGAGIVQLVNSYSNNSTTLAPTANALFSMYNNVRPDLFGAGYYTTSDNISILYKTTSINNLTSGTSDITFTANPANYPDGYEALIINNGNNQTFFFNISATGSNAKWFIPTSDIATFSGMGTRGKGGCTGNTYVYARKVSRSNTSVWLMYGPGVTFVT
jgi:hypothetical protein